MSQPAPDQPSRDDIWQSLGEMRVRVWTCINPEHRRCTWTGDVATCDECGLTSEHTRHWMALLSATVLRRVARDLASDYPDAAASLRKQAEEIVDAERPRAD